MTRSPRQAWDIKRFWQTLTYFEAVPFLNCLQRLFFGQSNVPVQPPLKENKMMTTVLVMNANSSVGEKVITHLLNRQFKVRVLGKKLGVAPNNFADPVEVLTVENITPAIFDSVSMVINCSPLSNEWEYQELFNLAQQYLLSPDPTIFDFTQPTDDLKTTWGAVDDVVMGGVSSSQIQVSRDCAIFSGQVSTANNGGFASVRTRNFSPPLNLAHYEGIEIRIKGDGKRYKLITRCEGKWDGLSYCYSFDTLNNTLQTLRIPFQQCIPVFRAKTVPEVGKFDPTSVYSLQLMHSKFEYDGGLNPTFSPGFFCLEIETIKAYTSKVRPQWIEIQPVLNSAFCNAVESLLHQSGLNYRLISCSEIDSDIESTLQSIIDS
jgi:uncharacterized protein YbjT (DUF2867 family)